MLWKLGQVVAQLTSTDCGAELRRFAETTGIPVFANSKGQGLLAHDHPNNAGAPGGLAVLGMMGLQRPDVVLLLGARMGEVPSAGYTLIDIPQPQQLLVHALPEAQDLGHLYRPDLALLATMPELARAFAVTDPRKRARSWLATAPLPPETKAKLTGK